MTQDKVARTGKESGKGRNDGDAGLAGGVTMHEACHCGLT